MSPPASLHAELISLETLEKAFPRLESTTALSCLILDQRLWPEASTAEVVNALVSASAVR